MFQWKLKQHIGALIYAITLFIRVHGPANKKFAPVTVALTTWGGYGAYTGLHSIRCCKLTWRGAAEVETNAFQGRGVCAARRAVSMDTPALCARQHVARYAVTLHAETREEDANVSLVNNTLPAWLLRAIR